MLRQLPPAIRQPVAADRKGALHGAHPLPVAAPRPGRIFWRATMAKKLAPTAAALALSAPKAAASLDIGPDLFAARVAPELKVIRLGSRRLYPVDELRRWVDESAQEPVAHLADERDR